MGRIGRHRTAASMLAVAVLVAGCGSVPAASSSVGVTQTAAVTPTALADATPPVATTVPTEATTPVPPEVATPVPTATVAATLGASPEGRSPSPLPRSTPFELPSVDPALETFLPTSFRGEPLEHTSVPGSWILTGGTDVCSAVCPGEPGRFAAALGVPIGDITIAFAVNAKYMPAIAYRARGVQTDRLVDARRAIGGISQDPTGVVTELHVAGHAVSFVWYMVTGRGEYLIAQGDVLAIIFGPQPGKDGSVPDWIEAEIAQVPS